MTRSNTDALACGLVHQENARCHISASGDCMRLCTQIDAYERLYDWINAYEGL